MDGQLRVVIEIGDVEPVEFTAGDPASAGDYLLRELGRSSGSAYPPVTNRAELDELVEAINDKLGASGVKVTVHELGASEDR